MENRKAGEILLDIDRNVKEIKETMLKRRDAGADRTEAAPEKPKQPRVVRYGINVPGQIPDITGRQIYKMSKMGWTVEQICFISGYSVEEAKRKYDTYVRNNV